MVTHLHAGLNYGYGKGEVQTGAQRITLKDPDCNVIMTATGGMCVRSGCPNDIYMQNYQVLPLTEGEADATCTEWPTSTEGYSCTNGVWTHLTGDEMIDTVHPCTTTFANSAIVAYATHTITDSATLYTGSSTTQQAGKSLTVQMASDMTIAVGTLTGSDLYTSVSSALMEGCTIATAGVTVTEYSDIPEITGISYFGGLEQNEDRTRRLVKWFWTPRFYDGKGIFAYVLQILTTPRRVR